MSEESKLNPLDSDELLRERWDNMDPSTLEAYYTSTRPQMHTAKVAAAGYDLDIDLATGRKIAKPRREDLEVIVDVLRKIRIDKTHSLRAGLEILKKHEIPIGTPTGLSKRLQSMLVDLKVVTQEEVATRQRKTQPKESTLARRQLKKEIKEEAYRAMRKEKAELAAMKKEMEAIKKAHAKTQKKMIRDAAKAGLKSQDLKEAEKVHTLKKDKSTSKTSPEAPEAPKETVWLPRYWEAVQVAEIPYETLMEMYDKAFEEIKSSDQPVLFLPTPKQYEFMSSNEDIVLYGGAAGGGKSYCLLFDAIEHANSPHMRSLVIRRSSGELTELIDKSNEIYTKLYPGAKYNQSKMAWTFPSGATLRFGFLEKPTDWQQYIGQPYTYIAFDEVQLQKTPEGFDKLRSRLRSAEGLPCYIRCTANPGGASWVKERFVDPADPGTAFESLGITYKFIKAKLTDNPHLAKDGQYLRMLESLPSEAQRRQLIEGDWDIQEESFFHFNKYEHVTPKGEYPPLSWPILNGLDYGYNDPACSLWAAIDPETDKMYVYRELEMIKATAVEFGRAVLSSETEANEQFAPSAGRVIDASLFRMTGHSGPGIREDLHNIGLRSLKPADRNREAGWVKVNEMFNSGQLYISEDCARLIDQLQTAVKDEAKTKADDIDQSHAYSFGRRHHYDMLDCLRYMCMSRPQAVKAVIGVRNENTWGKYQKYFS